MSLAAAFLVDAFAPTEPAPPMARTERLFARSGSCILVVVFGDMHCCASRVVPLDGADTLETSRLERPSDDELDDVRACLEWHDAEERPGPSPAVGRWLWKVLA